MEEWYPIYKIRFTKKEMWWLVFHLDELRRGEWPQDPQQSETGYSEITTGIKARRYREPAINRVLELAAEVEIRLELGMGYISGWPRPDKKIKKRRGL